MALGATSALANTTVTINGHTLQVTTFNGTSIPPVPADTNTISVAHDRLLRQFTVTDANEVDVAQNGNGTVPCQQYSINTVRCDDATVTAISVDAAGGNDTVTIQPDPGNPLYPATLLGGAGNDTLNAGSANDTLDGGAGTDTLNGNAGNDTFAQGSSNDGADAMNGGSGVDTVDYSGRSNDLIVNTSDGQAHDGEAAIALPPSSEEGDNVNADVEKILGGSGNDQLTGDNAAANTINGNDGDDQIHGGADPNAAGSAGDSLNGNGGNDSLDGGSGNDSLDGGDGNDTPINGYDGNDTLTGGAGNDTALDAGPGNDTLTGGDGNDAMVGGIGDDSFTDGAGDDTMNGNADNDVFDQGSAANGADQITGGAGTDTVDYGKRTTPTNVDLQAGND